METNTQTTSEAQVKQNVSFGKGYKPVFFTKPVIHEARYLFYRLPDDVNLDFPLIPAQVIKSTIKVLDGESVERVKENYFAIIVFLKSNFQPDIKSIKIDPGTDLCKEVDELIKGGKDNLLITKETKVSGSLGKIFKDLLGKVKDDDIVPYLEKGWTAKKFEFLWDMFEKEDKLNVELRKYEGFVIAGEGSRKKPGLIQGALSPSLFNHHCIQSFILKEDFSGYIGHVNRTFGSDRVIERVCRGFRWTETMIAVFLCSEVGNDIGNRIENLSDEKIEERLVDLLKHWDAFTDKSFQKVVAEESFCNN